MANNLMEIESKYVVNGEEVKLTGSIVRSYLTKGNENVSDQEVVSFINLCRYQKLNPFLNEAYLVKFKGTPAQLITSKEAYMKKAEANPNYDGMAAGIIVKRNNEIVELEGSFTLQGDVLLGGWAEVYRKDREHSYIAKVNFEEYNKGHSTWREKPRTMIRKVAIVQAMREAFPVELEALYVEEEMTDTRIENDVKEEIKNNQAVKEIDIDTSNVIDVEVNGPEEEPEF